MQDSSARLLKAPWAPFPAEEYRWPFKDYVRPGEGTWPPDYRAVYRWRMLMLDRYKHDPACLVGAVEYYRQPEHYIDFVNHWVDTYDPRNAVDPNLPTRLPLITFEKQAQLFTFLNECERDQVGGAVDKARDTGVTWLCCSFSVCKWLFSDGSSIGWGSRKQDLVDKLGVPDSIFEKMRRIIFGTPRVFWPEHFYPDKHMTFMRIVNPQNDATITGEAGDDIGRGGRKSIYFKDESAHYEHPESIEAALSENTNVQIDISTHKGVGTVFYRKIQAGQVWSPGCDLPKGMTRVFPFEWRDHPAKTQEWHDTKEQKAKDEGLLHLFRQEVDRDASASLAGIIINAEWVEAAVDAHLKLKMNITGGWSGSLDVADEGGDLNALTFRKGILLSYAEDWGEGDTGATARKAITTAQNFRPVTIQYDCVGVGAGVKSEYNRLKQEQKLPQGILLSPWDAGMGPLNPEARLISGDVNTPLIKDYFANVKAQGWWHLSQRFYRTYRAVKEGIKSYKDSELISLDSKLARLPQIKRELSQPVWAYTGDLKLLVDKKPEGARSPNFGDSIMMNYHPMKLQVVFTEAMVRESAVKR